MSDKAASEASTAAPHGKVSEARRAQNRIAQKAYRELQTRNPIGPLTIAPLTLLQAIASVKGYAI